MKIHGPKDDELRDSWLRNGYTRAVGKSLRNSEAAAFRQLEEACMRSSDPNVVSRFHEWKAYRSTAAFFEEAKDG